MTNDYEARLKAAIPGGAHTYSRGSDQFPANAPQILASGRGCRVVDPDGGTWLDYGMALRAVTLGYANDEVDAAASAAARLGNNLTRPSMIELEAAERLIDLIDSADMVKFTKNGSTSVSAAVKLARGFTGRDLVARCAQHPFFSFDDWFIASTPMTRGIPQGTAERTLVFDYGDIASLERVVDEHRGDIACVVLEPATTDHPPPSVDHEGETFLHDVRRLCDRHDIVMVLDEMITGFRWDLRGAQHTYGVTPDITTFGKAMANGYSVSAVAGRRDILDLGGIDEAGQERLFLLSTTHGAEMSGLAAFMATVDIIERDDAVGHLGTFGRRLIDGLNEIADNHGLGERFRAGGVEVAPWYVTVDAEGRPDPALRTLFLQETIARGVMIPWIALSTAHGDAELTQTLEAVDGALKVCSSVLDDPAAAVEGPVVQPVFRRFN